MLLSRQAAKTSIGFMIGWIAGIVVVTTLVLSGVNPKNLLMCVCAGTTIGAGHLLVGGDVAAVAIFTVLAASTVATPVVIYLSAKEKMPEPLTELRSWLTQNDARVVAVLMLVIGVMLIGKGIGGPSS
jgi:hypothetical protein